MNNLLIDSDDQLFTLIVQSSQKNVALLYIHSGQDQRKRGQAVQIGFNYSRRSNGKINF